MGPMIIVERGLTRPDDVSGYLNQVVEPGILYLWHLNFPELLLIQKLTTNFSRTPSCHTI